MACAKPFNMTSEGADRYLTQR